MVQGVLWSNIRSLYDVHGETEHDDGCLAIVLLELASSVSACCYGNGAFPLQVSKSIILRVLRLCPLIGLLARSI